MNLFPLLLAIFIVVPLVEIYILIKVGSVIGAFPTVFLVVFTAFLGVWLLRLQGFATMSRMRQTLQSGGIPAIELIEGVVLLIAGALLLTPGFFTDILGFLCLISPLRRNLIVKMFSSRIHTHVHRRQHQSRPHQSKTIEGEYRREKD